MSAATDATNLARRLRHEGWTVTRTSGNSRYRAVGPNGEGPVFWASTPSDHRWLRNTQAKISRARKTGAA